MFSQWLKKLASRWYQPQRRLASAKRPRRFTRVGVEPLEDRALLSTINWVNQGGSVDSDNFTAAYGGWDWVARNCVVAAIDAWESVIESFNYTDGHEAFILTLTAYPLDAALGSSGIWNIDSQGKPTAGWINMDIDQEWYFDQTPYQPWEFNQLVGPYVHTSSLDLDHDFYSVVLHEIGHSLGFSSGGDLAINVKLTPDGENLTFTGPTTEATLNDDSGLHTVFDDLMFPSIADNTRRLITGLDANLLAEAYGYTVNRPPTIEELTDVVHFDAGIGRLIVEGDQHVIIDPSGNPISDIDDTIVISRQGDHVKVDVNGFVHLQPVIDITDSIWIETRAGWDAVTIDLSGGQPVPDAYIRVDGGIGRNRLHIDYTGMEGHTLSLADGDIDAAGLRFIDFKNVEHIGVDLDGRDVVTVESTFARSGGTGVRILTRGGEDIINLEAANTNVTVQAGSEADIFNVGNLNDLVDDLHGLMSLAGQGGSDKLVFKNNGNSQQGEYLFNGGALTYTTDFHDDLEITHASIEEVTVFAGSEQDTFTAPFVPPYIQLTVHGGQQKDKLIAADTVNDWHIVQNNVGDLNSNIHFTSMEHLVGGADDDQFIFTNDKLVDYKVEGGGGGTDTLNYSDYDTPITVNVATKSATGTLRGYDDIQAVIGSLKSTGDLLVGPDMNATWLVLFANRGVLDWTANNVSGLMAFRLVENLTGGAMTDRFDFNGVGSVAGLVDGGDDSDTLNYSQFFTAIDVNLKTATATATGGFASIEEVVGGQHGADRLTGKGDPANESVWAITADNAGTVTTGPAAVVEFSNIENLAGESYKDRFQFVNGHQVDGLVSGGSGIDHLDYSQFGAGSVTVNLQTGAATATGGVSSIGMLTGSAGVATLIGPAGDSTWTLTGQDAGNVNGTFAFSNVDNLTAPGTGLFVFRANSGLTGSLNAGSNGALNYSAYHRTITVNLGAGTANGVIGGISNVRDVTGTIYEDKLTGDGGNNVLRGGGGVDVLTGLGGDDLLLGGEGDDTLEGGAGRDLLFGGAGADTLNGGLGEDLLIGGTTAYDNNDAALLSILQAWRGPGLYKDRIRLIRDIGVGSHLSKLDSTTVFDDNARDTMTGGSDLDWFWANLDRRDKITDLDEALEKRNTPGPP